MSMNIAYRIYGWLLFAYPPEFRRRFGSEMLLVFRDCYREEARRRTLAGFYVRTLFDLVLTVVKERSDRSGREGVLMNRRRDLMALLGCLAIIVIAALLLSYGRRHEVASILTFGYILDALVFTGVIGNLIVFLLVKTTRFNPLRVALWTFAVVHAVPLLFLTLILGPNDPNLNLPNVVVGYLVSFLFWTGLHWTWRMTSRQPTTE